MTTQNKAGHSRRKRLERIGCHKGVGCMGGGLVSSVVFSLECGLGLS